MAAPSQTPTANEVELVLDAHASTAESPTWSVRDQCLYWIDVEGPSLHRFDPADASAHCWELPSEVGAFALCRSGRVLAALRTGLFALDLDTGCSSFVAPPPYDPRTHRFNDGNCDAQGRFWVGTAYKPLAGAVAPPDERSQPLWRFDAAHGLVATTARAQLANGIAIRDHALYLTDSTRRTIHRFDLDPSGTVSAPRLFKRFDAPDKTPDGASLDVDGGYWCALFGAGRIVRIDRRGEIDREIALPVSQPTMCAFGGPELDELYVTSASKGLDSAESARQPHAGGLFRVRPGIRGQVPVLLDDAQGC